MKWSGDKTPLGLMYQAKLELQDHLCKAYTKTAFLPDEAAVMNICVRYRPVFGHGKIM